MIELPHFFYICPNTPCLDCPYADKCDDYQLPITIEELIKRCEENEEFSYILDSPPRI